MPILKLVKDLKKARNEKRAKIFTRFFKTGKGEYGEGDRFFGITIPVLRLIAKKYRHLSLADLQFLIKDKVHEIRLVVLMILRMQFEASEDIRHRKKIILFYLKNTHFINNWDLVDLSCQYIIGSWLLMRKKDLLYSLARSNSLWERRIAIVTTHEFLKNNQLEETLKISRILLDDSHDLIHKAVGWMLRELGKRNRKLLEVFLEENISRMPRTMLRYAIEKFDKKKRYYYLNLKK